MNKAKKNIVVVGFDDSKKKYIPIPSLSIDYYKTQKVHYIESLKGAYKYQGYMIIVNNKDNLTPIELDKKYRNTFNKFEIVIIYNKNYTWKEYKNKWFKLELIGDDLFNDLSYEFGLNWEQYKLQKENEIIKPIKFNKDKQQQLNILYKYTKKYKTRKTNDIVKDLNIKERTVERYMKDLNDLYHTIGYDYSLNEWYFS